jgi:hypothetical protein
VSFQFPPDAVEGTPNLFDIDAETGRELRVVDLAVPEVWLFNGDYFEIREVLEWPKLFDQLDKFLVVQDGVGQGMALSTGRVRCLGRIDEGLVVLHPQSTGAKIIEIEVTCPSGDHFRFELRKEPL